MCLSILDGEKDWRPSISISEILAGIQDLLDNVRPFPSLAHDALTPRPQPNNNDPAQSEPSVMLRNNPAEYRQRLVLQTKLFLAKPKV